MSEPELTEPIGADRARVSDGLNIIGNVRLTASGNTAIIIGSLTDDGHTWERTGYVVLSGADRLRLLAVLAAQASEAYRWA